MNRAQRLAAAGTIAPALRSQSKRARERRVARVADGKVVGYTTLAEVQRSLLERNRLEIETADGVRPETVVCSNCGRPRPVLQKIGRIPTLCDACTTQPCSECGKPTRTYRKTVVQSGSPRVCRSCRKAAGAPRTCECGATIGGRSLRCYTCNGVARSTARCKRGHEKSGVDKTGKRFCPECRRKANRNYRARRGSQSSSAAKEGSDG